jgi:hypothetical protein
MSTQIDSFEFAGSSLLVWANGLDQTVWVVSRIDWLERPTSNGLRFYLINLTRFSCQSSLSQAFIKAFSEQFTQIGPQNEKLKKSRLHHIEALFAPRKKSARNL